MAVRNEEKAFRNDIEAMKKKCPLIAKHMAKRMTGKKTNNCRAEETWQKTITWTIVKCHRSITTLLK